MCVACVLTSCCPHVFRGCVMCCVFCVVALLAGVREEADQDVEDHERRAAHVDRRILLQIQVTVGGGSCWCSVADMTRYGGGSREPMAPVGAFVGMSHRFIFELAGGAGWPFSKAKQPRLSQPPRYYFTHFGLCCVSLVWCFLTRFIRPFRRCENLTRRLSPLVQFCLHGFYRTFLHQCRRWVGQSQGLRHVHGGEQRAHQVCWRRQRDLRGSGACARG